MLFFIKDGVEKKLNLALAIYIYLIKRLLHERGGKFFLLMKNPLCIDIMHIHLIVVKTKNFFLLMFQQQRQLIMLIFIFF